MRGYGFKLGLVVLVALFSVAGCNGSDEEPTAEDVRFNLLGSGEIPHPIIFPETQWELALHTEFEAPETGQTMYSGHMIILGGNSTEFIAAHSEVEIQTGSKYVHG